MSAQPTGDPLVLLQTRMAELQKEARRIELELQALQAEEEAIRLEREKQKAPGLDLRPDIQPPGATPAAE